MIYVIFIISIYIHITISQVLIRASLVAQMGKNLPAMQTRVQFLHWKDPLEKGKATHPVFLPGEFHGQRSLAGCSQWGHKESDTTE